jgi:hypothetical protein
MRPNQRDESGVPNTMPSAALISAGCCSIGREVGGKFLRYARRRPFRPALKRHDETNALHVSTLCPSTSETRLATSL